MLVATEGVMQGGLEALFTFDIHPLLPFAGHETCPRIMAYFSTDDTEVRKRVEQLEKAVKQSVPSPRTILLLWLMLRRSVSRKDSLYQTLENVHVKLQADFQEIKDSLKLSQYNLSVETRRAAEAETTLEKTRLETRDFPTQRYNFESTIRNHEAAIQSKDKVIKQLERGKQHIQFFGW